MTEVRIAELICAMKLGAITQSEANEIAAGYGFPKAFDALMQKCRRSAYLCEVDDTSADAFSSKLFLGFAPNFESTNEDIQRDDRTDFGFFQLSLRFDELKLDPIWPTDGWLHIALHAETDIEPSYSVKFDDVNFVPAMPNPGGRIIAFRSVPAVSIPWSGTLSTGSSLWGFEDEQLNSETKEFDEVSLCCEVRNGIPTKRIVATVGGWPFGDDNCEPWCLEPDCIQVLEINLANWYANSNASRVRFFIDHKQLACRDFGSIWRAI
jgi:hypothetical protein